MVAGAKREVNPPQNGIERGDQANHDAVSLQGFEMAAVQQGAARDANQRAAVQDHFVHDLRFNGFEMTFAIARADTANRIIKTAFNAALDINHLQAKPFGKLAGDARALFSETRGRGAAAGAG